MFLEFAHDVLLYEWSAASNGGGRAARWTGKWGGRPRPRGLSRARSISRRLGRLRGGRVSLGHALRFRRTPGEWPEAKPRKCADCLK